MNEKPKSGVTQQELIGWGGEVIFNQALAIVNSGDVTEAEYDDDSLEIRGKIAQPSGWEMPVSFTLKPGGRIESHCPCESNRRFGMVCPHVVAIGIAVMVKEMDEDEWRALCNNFGKRQKDRQIRRYQLDHRI